MSQPDLPLAHIPPQTDLEHSSGLGEPANTPQPQSDHGQTPRGDFGHDGSESLFSMYLDRVIEEDNKMMESWKGDVDGILVFTGLFSAVTATLLAVSISDIRPIPQNTSQPSIPSSTGLSNQTVPFSVPTLSVWVNGLWFSSLVISLTSALLAILVQQWARRYKRVAYPRSRYHPHKRARVHAFYRRGINQYRIDGTIDASLTLLHVSLFLFFPGLSAFLFGVHRTIFKVVTAWMGVCVILYACLSVFPVTRKDSPYFTPLSGIFSFWLTGIRYLVFRRFPNLGRFIRRQLPSPDPGEVYIDNFFTRSMILTAEQYASKLDPDIDYCSLLWTFDSLDEDAEFEKFFEGLTRLCDSELGEILKLQQNFIRPNQNRLSNALIGLMDRTLSSNLVKEKHRRIIIFTKVIESKTTSLLDPSRILRRVLFEDWHGLLGCFEFGHSMRNWANISNKVSVTSFYAKCVATLTLSVVRKQDERWIQLAENLPVSSPLHPHEHDDTILLAQAIFVVRITVQTYSGSEEGDWDNILNVSRRTFGAVSRLDIRHCLPELQHEFCDLWNKLVIAAQTGQLPHHRSVSVKMLKNIRKLYIALHDASRTTFNTADDWEQVLDNSEFYPECAENGHRPASSFPNLQFNPPHTQSAPSPTGI